jgi:hypothetical protein
MGQPKQLLGRRYDSFGAVRFLTGPRFCVQTAAEQIARLPRASPSGLHGVNGRHHLGLPINSAIICRMPTLRQFGLIAPLSHLVAEPALENGWPKLVTGALIPDGRDLEDMRQRR